jgi:C1A family cysteine protease
VPQNSSSALKAAVAQQPVAVSLDASNFRLYTGGILDDVNCFTVTNHGVTVVGYGVNTVGVAYWIVKNSWGRGWGQNGYIYI